MPIDWSALLPHAVQARSAGVFAGRSAVAATHVAGGGGVGKGRGERGWDEKQHTTSFFQPLDEVVGVPSARRSTMYVVEVPVDESRVLTRPPVSPITKPIGFGESLEIQAAMNGVDLLVGSGLDHGPEESAGRDRTLSQWSGVASASSGLSSIDLVQDLEGSTRLETVDGLEVGKNLEAVDSIEVVPLAGIHNAHSQAEEQQTRRREGEGSGKAIVPTKVDPPELVIMRSTTRRASSRKSTSKRPLAPAPLKKLQDEGETTEDDDLAGAIQVRHPYASKARLEQPPVQTFARTPIPPVPKQKRTYSRRSSRRPSVRRPSVRATDASAYEEDELSMTVDSAESAAKIVARKISEDYRTIDEAIEVGTPSSIGTLKKSSISLDVAGPSLKAKQVSGLTEQSSPIDEAIEVKTPTPSGARDSVPTAKESQGPSPQLIHEHDPSQLDAIEVGTPVKTSDRPNIASEADDRAAMAKSTAHALASFKKTLPGGDIAWTQRRAEVGFDSDAGVLALFNTITSISILFSGNHMTRISFDRHVLDQLRTADGGLLPSSGKEAILKFVDLVIWTVTFVALEKGYSLDSINGATNGYFKPDASEEDLKPRTLKVYRQNARTMCQVVHDAHAVGGHRVFEVLLHSRCNFARYDMLRRIPRETSDAIVSCAQDATPEARYPGPAPLIIPLLVMLITPWPYDEVLAHLPRNGFTDQQYEQFLENLGADEYKRTKGSAQAGNAIVAQTTSFSSAAQPVRGSGKTAQNWPFGEMDVDMPEAAETQVANGLQDLQLNHTPGLLPAQPPTGYSAAQGSASRHEPQIDPQLLAPHNPVPHLRLHLQAPVPQSFSPQGSVNIPGPAMGPPIGSANSSSRRSSRSQSRALAQAANPPAQQKGLHPYTQPIDASHAPGPSTSAQPRMVDNGIALGAQVPLENTADRVKSRKRKTASPVRIPLPQTQPAQSAPSVVPQPQRAASRPAAERPAKRRRAVFHLEGPKHDKDGHESFKARAISQHTKNPGIPDTWGHQNNMLMVSLLKKARLPITNLDGADEPEAWILSGDEAFERIETMPPGKPIIMYDQQAFDWPNGKDVRPIKQLRDYMENLDREVSIQIPSRPIVQVGKRADECTSYELHTLRELLDRMEAQKVTEDPWNALDLQSPLPSNCTPKPLTGLNASLLLRMRDVALSANSGQRHEAKSVLWQKWKDVIEWLLISEAGHCTGPHMDSNGFSTYITVQEGCFGVCWLDPDSKRDRERWINDTQTTEGKWRYVVLKPRETIFFTSGTIHSVFRLRETDGEAQTLAVGGHILQWTGLRKWLDVIEEQIDNPHVTNEEMVDVQRYVETVAYLVQKRKANGELKQIGTEEAADEILARATSFLAEHKKRRDRETKKSKGKRKR